jgi:replicative DNA helicase
VAVQREPKPSLERVPPQNIEAEQAVLGAMLLNSDAVGAVIEVLREDPVDLFYVEAHKQIFQAIIALFRENRPVDEITLVDQLKRDGHYESSGGASYVAQLSGIVPTSANAEHYAKIVLNAAILRKLITTCTVIASSAYEGEEDANELLDRAENSIFSIAQTRELNPISKVGDLVNAAIEQIERLIASHTGISGLATGYTKLDEMLSGLQPSDMVVLAARPSVGKTALALNIASHVAIRENKGVMIFSLEMSREQLAQRLLCMEGRIDSARLRSGFLAKDEMSKLQPAASRLYSAPIYIDDTANITMLEIRSKARRHKAQHDVQLIIIDYLQLMSGTGSNRRVENRQVEISEISRNIKGLARELHLPVLALSQLSREAEKDDTGIPKLSHLRESGSIEQDADVVLMLWRLPAHQNPEDENLIKVSIAKQRNGPTGIVDLLFLKNMQRFENMAKPAGAIEPDEEEYGQQDDGAPF